MLFNSVEFAIFLPIVFIVYWLLKGQLRAQNFFLFVVSYFFYGWWDWRFLLLIGFSSLLDYWVGIQLSNKENVLQRKLLLAFSLSVNLGLLAFFKYYNFFVSSFVDAYTFFGQSIEVSRLSIILPVGISFYTFQTLSYSLDIYKRDLKPTHNLIDFLAFVSFFPQLVAGPIERASHLLPQFQKQRVFSYSLASSSVSLIIWGLFKKVVIADNAAIIVDGIFNNQVQQSSISLLVGMFLFAFQIYCDFSGYSDMAIGLGRLFGFDLMTNFKFPYLSPNISDFWKRWHISLSTWFRDYIYFPLGGSRTTQIKMLRNLFVVFFVSGFWHGANWTFLVWGLLHFLLYVPLFMYLNFFDKDLKKNILFTYIGIILNFCLVSFAWIFFRANTVSDAYQYIQGIFSNTGKSYFFMGQSKYLLITLNAVMGIMILMSVESYFYFKKKIFEVKFSAIILLLLCIIITFFGAFKNHANFIYFQF